MFEINVSLNGSHFFATHERSLRSTYDLNRVLPELQSRFKPEDGFEISVSYNPQISYGVTLEGGETVDQICEHLLKKGGV